MQWEMPVLGTIIGFTHCMGAQISEVAYGIRPDIGVPKGAAEVDALYRKSIKWGASEIII